MIKKYICSILSFVLVFQIGFIVKANDIFEPMSNELFSTTEIIEEIIYETEIIEDHITIFDDYLVEKKRKGTTKPSSNWNLNTKGEYTFSGRADASTLYSNYYFTGKDNIEIKATNYRSDKNLTVKLMKMGLIDTSKSTVTIPKNGETKWRISGLNKNDRYYLRFSAPSNFSGYIR